jgi:voltage-gated potassium channel
MDDQNRSAAPRVVHGGYQLFVLVLCVFALASLMVEYLAPLDPSTRQLLGYADTVVCLLFFADFLHSLITAENRWKYMLSWGWIDLLSSIPTVDLLRLGRFARVLRIFRILRAAKATHFLASLLVQRRGENGLFAAAVLSLLLLVVSSVAILGFENLPTSNIKGAEDALWWALTTMTTVGYGDRFPVTWEGRLIGVLLMVSGVGLFGVFSGFLASWFMAPKSEKEQRELDQLEREVGELRAAVGRIERMLMERER